MKINVSKDGGWYTESSYVTLIVDGSKDYAKAYSSSLDVQHTLSYSGCSNNKLFTILKIACNNIIHVCSCLSLIKSQI